MLQRQIVVKALVKQIDTEGPALTKYAIVSYNSIALILISISITIYRTIALPQ